jgi:hypothetical protein
LPLPSGERGEEAGSTFSDHFDASTWDAWRYYGYCRYIWAEEGCLSLGGHPKWGLINHYRSGEKAVVRGLAWSDLHVRVRVRVVAGQRDAGILFRVRQPAVGYDAQKGYFAGLIATGKVVLGKTDGNTWKQIALVDQKFAPGDWHELFVQARGEEITVGLDGKTVIEARDGDYRSGLVGLRVVDTHALFDDFEVRR